MNRLLPLVLAGALSLVMSNTALALKCGFGVSPTWREEAPGTDLIAIGRIVQSRLSDPKTGAGESLIRLERIVHRHPLFQERDIVSFPRNVNIPEDQSPQAYLFFAVMDKGKLDVYKGMPITSPQAVHEYLSGLLALDETNLALRVEFCLRHATAADAAVVEDAFKELRALSAADLIRSSRGCDRRKVRELLADAKISNTQLGVLSLILAGCGKPADAPQVGGFIERNMGNAPGSPATQSALDSLLIAYTALAPEAGFAAIHRLVSDPKQDFLHRYAALRALRYLHENPVKPIEPQAVINAVMLLLDQPDICDLPMQDLRSWSRWELAGKIISYYGRQSYDLPIIKRSVIRFALCARRAQPDNILTADFLDKCRAENSALVREIEEQIESERK